MWRTVFVLPLCTLIVAIYSARSTSATGSCECGGPTQGSPANTTLDAAQCAVVTADGCYNPDQPLCDCSTATSTANPPGNWWCDHNGIAKCVECLDDDDCEDPEICCTEVSYKYCGTEDPDEPGTCEPLPTPEPTPTPATPTPEPVCPNGDVDCGDPHMAGLLGQRINWSGVDGGWYSLIKDDNADLNVNVRVTAPLPDEFPDRQLMTSLAVVSEGHSLVIQVANPYTIDTDGCPERVSPCLANGGLSIIVDGQEVDELLRFSREMPVADGAMTVSASNLPVECRQFGGHKIWARIHQEMLQGRRKLLGGESLEDWILRNEDGMPAPGWCAKYIAENDPAELQSTHAIFKIETSTVTVRLNAGVNYQGNGELDWDGRVLPDLEFWQMDVGMRGLDVDNPALSGLLGETARPVYDENGQAVMKGSKAFRGSVEDYRVSGALGVHFPLLDDKEEGHE
ncbi:unnamed protein product [Ectocarpus sp. 8 AP-2014]